MKRSIFAPLKNERNLDLWPDNTKKEFDAHLEKLQNLEEQHTAVQLSARMNLKRNLHS